MTSLNGMRILLRLFSVRRGKMGRETPFISNFQFEGKIEAKSVALSDEYDFRAIYNSGHIRFAAVHNLASGLPEFARSSLFLFYLRLDSSCVATHCVFYNYLTVMMGDSESSKSQTTQLLAIYFEVVVLVSYV